MKIIEHRQYRFGGLRFEELKDCKAWYSCVEEHYKGSQDNILIVDGIQMWEV